MPKMPASPTQRLLPTLRRFILVRDTADRTDGQLLTAFLRERDGDAFAALVRRHGPMVLGVARRVIGDFHTADDAFQAVFLVLARRASAVRPRERVGNWLYGVAYRTAMKARAVLARRRSREKQVDAMPETPVKSADSWCDLQPVIDEELARLPDKLRLPVVLCDLEGRPQRSVAKQLGVAPATLAARLAEARRLLAMRLSRRGICLSGGALAVVLGERASAAMVAPMLAESAVQAAEAIAAGIGTSGLNGLVSAHAIQLCEGVMRMMLLNKLKTAAIGTLVAFALTGGVGFGLLPAQAGDEPKATQVTPRPQATTKATQPLDDATFLRRLTLDLTGVLPSRIEMDYFTADADAKKRAKVIDWLIADDAVKAALAKKLGVPVEQLKIVLTRNDEDGAAVVRVVSGRIRLARAGAIQALDNKLDLNDLVVWSHILELTNPSKPTPVLDFDADGRVDLLWTTEPPPAQDVPLRVQFYVLESHADFLKKATQSARGSDPTPLEAKYFAEDKDPKKREKLLDTLLKDPAVAKKLGDAWKKKMLEPASTTAEWKSKFRIQTVIRSLPAPSKIEKLVDELIASKKTDEQVLEALTLAAASRLPTAEEKKSTLAVLGTLTDKKAAWVAIAKALTPAK